MAIVDPCSVPVASCNPWYLQSPAMQSWLLLQLLNDASAKLGGTVYTLEQLKTASQGYLCQGSPAKLKLIQAQLIAEGLSRANTSQPVCWTPLELQSAITYAICVLLAQLNGDVIL